MVSPLILRTVYHRAFIFHKLIVPGEGLTPISLGQGSKFILFITELSYVICRLLLVRARSLLILGSQGRRSRSQWPFLQQCKNGFCSLSWELFITKLIYFTWWLVLVRTRSLSFLSSLGQRSRLHGVTLVIKFNHVNSFYWTSLNLLIIKPEGTYPIPIYKVTSCQSFLFYNMNLFLTGSLYLLTTLLSKPLFDRRSQGAYVSFNISCYNLLFEFALKKAVKVHVRDIWPPVKCHKTYTCVIIVDSITQLFFAN